MTMPKLNEPDNLAHRDYESRLRSEYADLLGGYQKGRRIEIRKGWWEGVETMLKNLLWLCELCDEHLSIGLIKRKLEELRVQGVTFPEGTFANFRSVVASIISHTEILVNNRSAGSMGLCAPISIGGRRFVAATTSKPSAMREPLVRRNDRVACQ